MRRCPADELENEEGRDGKIDAGSFAERVVEDLSDWLINWRGENVGCVTHAEAKDDVEKPSKDVGAKHSHGDGPWSLDLRLIDPVKVSIGDVRGDRRSYSSVI